MNPILVVVPSELECQRLRPSSALPDNSSPYLVWRDGKTLWATVGIGAAAAGITTSLLVQHFQPEKVFLLGIAGVFPLASHKLGDVVQVEEDRFADLGYESDGQLVSLDEMGFAMLPTMLKSHTTVLPILKWRQGGAPGGKAITVNLITASQERANQLFEKYGADLEQMEGAGVALACTLLNVPFFHIRGISNFVGPREPKKWQVEEACNSLRQWIQREL